MAVVEADDAPEVEVARYRDLGAPLVLVCRRGHLELWKQSITAPEWLRTVKPADLDDFFRHEAEQLSPQAIYRAKTLGRFEPGYQLSFVDAGLVPLLEEESGRRLSGLVVDVVVEVKERLAGVMTPEQGEWLLREIFWLLAAKILRDKGVPSFSSLDLAEVEDVRARVASHYGAQREVRRLSASERRVMSDAATRIARFSHLGQVTTESLAYVYENALVSKETRTTLGTHSTPNYLVDYILTKLTPWIEQIPVERRHVLEPACGHAAFLVSAMRVLREFLPQDMSERFRMRYLRQHLHGIETDPLAREIARLSLSLADIPNPNGWKLDSGDMYEGNVLEQASKLAGILLANPPYEDFEQEDKEKYAAQGFSLSHHNKAVEMLRRTLPNLPLGAVFGIVVQQNFLSSKSSEPLRSLLVHEFELLEVCMLPDGVFSYADHETAVLMGRRSEESTASRARVTYRRVREGDLARFSRTSSVTSEWTLPQAKLIASSDANLRLPDLYDVWKYSPANFAGDLATIQQGITYHGVHLPAGTPTISEKPFPGGVLGFPLVDPKPLSHELPVSKWMNLDRAAIRRELGGATTGMPQVLLPYAPLSRGPWRLTAWLDRSGHPISSRFLAVRPRSPDLSLEFFWALFNSPYANAYAYAHGDKRTISAGLMRRMPVPKTLPGDVARVAGAANAYLKAARNSSQAASPEREEELRELLLKVDAEVLRLYRLPPRVERMLLDVFAGQQREGVSFAFKRYFPEDFESWIPLHEYLSEGYRQSTAAHFLEKRNDQKPPGLIEALSTAVEFYKD